MFCTFESTFMSIIILIFTAVLRGMNYNICFAGEESVVVRKLVRGGAGSLGPKSAVG